MAQLAAGVTITTVAQSDGRAKPLTAPTLPCVVERDAAPAGRDAAPAGRANANRSPAVRALRFVLREGRNRQIRRMCEAVGHPVDKLSRVSIGTLKLGRLPPGAAVHSRQASAASTVVLPAVHAATSLR